MHKIIPKNITRKQAADTGMAMVLILLVAGQFAKNDLFTLLAVAVLVLNMTVPVVFNPVAVVWLGFSGLLGSVVSKILLSVIYVVMVVPLGLIRRLSGKDPLLLSGFKKGRGSVMRTRDHKFGPGDINHPY